MTTLFYLTRLVVKSLAGISLIVPVMLCRVAHFRRGVHRYKMHENIKALTIAYFFLSFESLVMDI